MSKVTRKIALGTLLAGLVGYVTGLLTAPKSGKETRGDIQRAAKQAKTKAERNLKQLHSELNDLLEAGKQKAVGTKNQAKDELEKAMEKGRNAKSKARELLSALHDGDADDEDLDRAIKDVKKAIKHLKTFVNKNEKTE